MEQGKDNGATNLELIDEKKRLHELVPAVVGKFAMISHNSGIVDPFGYTIAWQKMPMQTVWSIILAVK